VLSLIDTLLHSDSLQIDPDRVYVTGYSLGGEGTFDIIARAPDLFAAAIPICGIADTAKAQLMVNTALWIFHGSEDDINDVNYSRIIVDALEKIGKPPKYTEYE
jgi:predicted peptidase